MSTFMGAAIAPALRMGWVAMQRFMTHMLVGLSITIAVIVGMLGWQAMKLNTGRTAIERVDPAVGVAFYAGLNRALAGESDSGLEAAVTDDFIDHTGDADSGKPADALIDQLTTLGQSLPGIQLSVTNIRPSGDNLIAEVVPVIPEPAQIAGLTLTAQHLTGGIEVLRVRRGQVSQRWASALPSLSAATYPDAAHALYTNTDLSARLYRIELLPGGALSWIADELSIAMVESGSLAMTLEKPNEMATPVTETVIVEAGAAVSIPWGARLRLRSTSIDGATLLLFAAHDVSAEIPRPFRLEGDVKSTFLWNSPFPFALPESARIQVGRIELPENVGIALAATSETEVVAGIQGGPLDVTTDGGTIFQRNDNYAIEPVDSPIQVESGGVLQFSQASAVDLRATSAGGASIWLVTVGPIDPEVSAFELPPYTPTPGLPR